MPVDAERWLAERGIRREPVLEALPTASAPGSTAGPTAGHEPASVPAAEAASEAEASGVPGADPTPPAPAWLEGEHGALGGSDRTIDGAIAFIRRSASNSPQSEGRLRTKLIDRGYREDVIDGALVLARSERIVDDVALLAALIIERRARGHADLRLRRDLRDRGFTGTQVDDALVQHAATDPAAAVFALAREQAARHRTVEAEAAVRRTVGFLVRRGHSEAFARKAARDAVYADREAQRIAGR